jgi:hypothetical protein
MEGLVENEKCAEWKRIQVLGMLACRPETERAVGVLREVVGDRKRFSVRLRGAAAEHLCLLGHKPDVSAGDLRLLYAAGHEAAVTEFRRRLCEGDAKARAAALKLLEMAPDAVIAALEPEFAKLPEGEKAQGRKLVGEAKARLGAIADFDDRE